MLAELVVVELVYKALDHEDGVVVDHYEEAFSVRGGAGLLEEVGEDAGQGAEELEVEGVFVGFGKVKLEEADYCEVEEEDQRGWEEVLYAIVWKKRGEETPCCYC